MRWHVALAATLLMMACKTHLQFVEGSHMGLRMKVNATEMTPAEIDLGYRRGMAVIIPRQAVTEGALAGPIIEKPDDNTVIIRQDPHEVMSLYSRFKANVGFMDPVEVRHFLATGNAATLLLGRKNQLDQMTADWSDGDDGSSHDSDPDAGADADGGGE
jgi:hypothetical protein